MAQDRVHVHLLPSDASPIRHFSFSRLLLFVLAGTLLPLSLLGYYLFFSGALREDEARSQFRRKLRTENRLLEAKTSHLREEGEGLAETLDRLERENAAVLRSAGLEFSGSESAKKEGTLRAFFAGLAPIRTDIARRLQEARAAGRFLDSAYLLLDSHSGLESLPTAFPLDPEALLTRGFGPALDPFTGKRSFHGGMDWALPPGSPVYAAGAGRVSQAGEDERWGYYLRLDHGRGIQTFYAHLQGLAVAKGQRVERRERVGAVGSSGFSSGPHLHFELWVDGERVDPERFFLPDAGGLLVYQ